MYPGCLPTIVEFLRNQLLTVAVGVEIDGAGWDDADEIWAEAFEQGAGAFNARDGDEDLEGFADVEECGAVDGEGGWGRYAELSAPGGELGLVEV